MATSYITFDVQLMDIATGKAIISSGGKAYVSASSTTFNKATLYNPDNDFAALANPITPTRGKLRFSVAQAGGGQTTQPSVNIYVMAPGGQFAVANAVKPSEPSEIWIDTRQVVQRLVVPFHFTDFTAATEMDTGFDFAAGTTILPWPSIFVKAIDATETIDVGLLSSESGGDANGFIAAVSVGTLGQVKTTFATTVTQGALLAVTATGAAAVIPEQHTISTAVSLTYTITTGSDTAIGLIQIPYSING